MYCPNCGTRFKKGFCTHCGYMRTGQFIDSKKDIDEGLLSYYFGSKYDFYIRNQNWFFVGIMGPAYIFSNGFYFNGFLLYIIDVVILLSIFVLNHMFILTYLVRFLNITVLFLSRWIWASIGNTIYLRLLNRRLVRVKRRNPENYKEIIQGYFPLDHMVIWLKYLVYGVVFVVTFIILREILYNYLVLS